MSNYHEIYPETFTLGNGLVFDISNIQNIPWNESDDDVKHHLERLYGLRSCFKNFVSTFEKIPNENRADIVATMFAEKWQKLWKDFHEEYNPLHGYVMNESETRHKEHDESKNIEYGRQISNQNTDTGTITDNSDEEVQSNANFYGYNSSVGVPTDTAGEHTTANNTQTRNLSNGGTTSNSGSDTTASDGTEDETVTISKTGNIGYSSPQSLLREDIELWARAYFDIVFSDIDSLIMLQVY